ncbi:MAG: GAF domain-containing protein [Catenulispora sp.]
MSALDIGLPLPSAVFATSDNDGRRLRAAHERFVVSDGSVSAGTPPEVRPSPEVRPLVADSWRRSAAAGVSADGSRLPPVRTAREELAVQRRGHPLAGLLPLLRGLLGADAADDGHVFAVGDVDGTLLWVEGDTAALERAARMRFVEGAVWTEAQAGTNAPGTALALGRPVQIRGAEHYSAVVQPWSCAAAPVRDPADGRLLGVVDVTGGGGGGTPAALAAVRAAVRAAETEIARRTEAADGRALRAYLDRLLSSEPGPRTPAALLAANGRVLHAVPGYAVADLWDGRPVTMERLGPDGYVLVQPESRQDAPVRLTALGRDAAVLETAGRTHRLSPRHSEIVVALALAGHGMSADRLAVDLSEQELHSSTMRAEMTRLRAVLGPELLGSRPYSLLRPVWSDFGAVDELLAEGSVTEAMALYTGPLLPASQAPAVVEHRRALEQQLRGAVLAGGDAVSLRRWVDTEWGSGDTQAWRALADRLPGGSPQRAAAAARARLLTVQTRPRPVAAVLQRCRP